MATSALAAPGSGRSGRDDAVPLWRLVAHALAVFAIGLVTGLALLASLSRLIGYDPVIVASGSMSPALGRGDIVLTRPVDDRGAAVGDVVNHHIDGGRRIHRVVEVAPDGLRTKGDANRGVDPSPVDPDDVLGVGRLVVPHLGLPVLWAVERDMPRLVATVVAAVVVLHVARPRWLQPAPDSN